MTNQCLMAVGAHADDIELRVGGTLTKYHGLGYDVAYIMSTNNFAGGQVSFEGETRIVRKHPPETQMEIRKREAEAGAGCFDTRPIHWDFPQRHYNHPDGSLAELRYGCEKPSLLPENIPSILTAHEDEEAVRMVVSQIMELAPEAILTHGMAQKDMEHVGTCLLVTRAYWKAVEQGFDGALLYWQNGFPWMGRCNNLWDTYVDVSGFMDEKLKAVRMHQSQTPAHTLHSVETCRQWGNLCGCEAAEIFMAVNLPESSLQNDFITEISDHLDSPREIESVTR